MPAATRSSMAPAAQHDSPSGNSTNPTRKVHRCTKCQRPRAGHPRSGCPFVDAQATGSTPKREEEDQAMGSGDAKGRRKLEDVSNAMGSMNLRATPARELEEQEDERANGDKRRKGSRPPASLKPADTLLSLTTPSQEIVEKLLQPGGLDGCGEETEPEESQTSNTSNTPKRKAARVVQWRDSILEPTPEKRPARFPRSSVEAPMPGTLIVPNASFFQSLDSIPSKTSSREVNCSTSPVSDIPSPIAPPKQKTKAKPLARSMSMEERDKFLLGLGPMSSAAIYVLPKADIYAIADAAGKLGFITGVVVNDDDEDQESLLVLGRQDNEVARLLALVRRVEDTKIRQTSSRDSATDKPRSSTMKVAAGGVVAGAVGTWMSLAFT